MIDASSAGQGLGQSVEPVDQAAIARQGFIDVLALAIEAADDAGGLRTVGVLAFTAGAAAIDTRDDVEQSLVVAGEFAESALEPTVDVLQIAGLACRGIIDAAGAAQTACIAFHMLVLLCYTSSTIEGDCHDGNGDGDAARG